jgi:hypothetical protein
MTPLETLMQHFRAYLDENNSPVAKADDALLERIIRVNEGARTLEQIEQKTRFAFLDDDAIEYDEKAVKKVLLKGNGLAMLAAVGEALATHWPKKSRSGSARSLNRCGWRSAAIQSARRSLTRWICWEWMRSLSGSRRH